MHQFDQISSPNTVELRKKFYSGVEYLGNLFGHDWWGDVAGANGAWSFNES